jgi:hypothetical protein
VIEIPVGEQDQTQLIGKAAEALEFTFEVKALSGEAGVYQQAGLGGGEGSS